MAESKSSSEKRREYQRKYREEHREKFHAYHKKYREKHRAQLSKSKKKYRLKKKLEDQNGQSTTEFLETNSDSDDVKKNGVKKNGVESMKRGRFQHDDFITDSVYSADGHIAFEGLKLKDYSVHIQRNTNGFYLLVTLIFERCERRSELNLVEKLVDEAQHIFRRLDLERKVFQFNDLTMYANLYFSKINSHSFIAPMQMQRQMKRQNNNALRTQHGRG